MPGLMSAADLLVSKLGNMFNEAVASALPLIALEPPPGAERLQYRLLGEWNVGRPVRTIDELVRTVTDLLNAPAQLEKMRENARIHGKNDAATQLANWLCENESRIRLPTSEQGACSRSRVRPELAVLDRR